ncbi:hypothetical protein FHS59_001960 [Algoriphagus iocasae]|uniref:Uncharacterized protein n=1 Tax=Algoriphagus iocasae TaxID=1836499 RepID=A0A841ME29_9BACT|nr:hypothetical protein [Algoriphagus iocasae]MBB6326332.1 hypothetical protein [Algoriphagus iocasae]
MTSIFTPEVLKYLVSVTGLTGLAGLIIYFAKKFIDKLLDVGVDHFKKDLQKELENYKHELENKNFEFQTKFSSLHLERLEAIKNLYLRLQNFKSNLSHVLIHLNMIPAPELKDEVGFKLSEDLFNSYSELIEFFSTHKIFFSKEIDEKIGALDKFFVEHNLQSINVQTWESNRALRNSKEFDEFLEDEYQKLIGLHKIEINKVLLELEDKFREMLGVN